MQNVKRLLADIDKKNRQIDESIKRSFCDTIISGTKEHFKQIVGIKQFGYSPLYSENYQKIKWREK